MPEAGWVDETNDEARQAISVRAHELYEARGGEPGRDHEDWFEAERQLRDEGVIPGGTSTDSEAVDDE